jgi:hypothetical protein
MRESTAVNRQTVCACAVSAAALVSGCGGDDGPVKYEVTGTVTVNGEPLDEGDIRFLPEDGRGTVGATRITDGAFTLMSEAGAKRVEIRSAKEREGTGGLPRTQPPGAMMLPGNLRFETIPKMYNQESTLTAEVTSNGENHFEFRLEK